MATKQDQITRISALMTPTQRQQAKELLVSTSPLVLAYLCKSAPICKYCNQLALVEGRCWKHDKTMRLKLIKKGLATPALNQ